MSKIPIFILNNTGQRTSRKFKSLKRKQLREVFKAMDDLRLACAHFPNSTTDFDAANKALNSIKHDISVNNWGN